MNPIQQKHVNGVHIAPDAALDPLATNVKSMLEQLGENPQREGLLKTPHRAAQAMRYLTRGYQANLTQIVNDALFEAEVDEMVIVRDIEYFSLCEHHLLPFNGRVHVAYLPDKKIIGLSKIPRIVDMFSQRLQVQERMTHEIAETLQKVLDARGVGVIAEGKHFCMMMRGVEKQCSSTTTSAMLGEFRTSKSTRDEFLSLLRMRSDF